MAPPFRSLYQKRSSDNVAAHPMLVRHWSSFSILGASNFKMKRALILLFLSPLFSLAQNSGDTANVPYWIDMMQDPDVNFYTTQRAFNTYWKNRPLSRANGFKAFKRWEWFMEGEVNPDGTYRDRNDMEREFRRFDRLYNTAHNSPGFSAQSTNGIWTNLGPIALPANGTGQPNGMGRINCVGLHPSDTATILIGAPNGGIWKTTDHGTSWTSNSDTLFSMQVSNIRFNPLDPNIVYAGTGDRDAGSRSQKGVLKSTDGGTSWLISNNGMGNRTVGMIILHPSMPDTILAATNAGIYKSVDAGANWSRKSSNTSNYKDIVFQPNNPQVVYATEGGRFYRSTDVGESWTQITSGLPSGTRGVIGVSEDDSAMVYLVLAQGSAYKGTYRSTDGGLNFTTRSTTPNIMDWSTTGSGTGGQAWYDLDVAVDPNDADVLYVGGVNIFKSSDGGSTWTIEAHWVGSGGADAIHADQHALEWSSDGERLYVGNDGGIYYLDHKDDWIDISSGIAITEIYKIGQARHDEDMVINGYQDNGSAIYYGPSNWSTEIGGDGMECAVDPADVNYVYGTVYFGRIFRSQNGGSSFGTIAGSGINGITESGAWVTPYTLAEGNPNQMFVGFRNIWRSDSVKVNGTGNVSWTKLSNNLGGTNSQTIRVVEHSPADPNLLYFARADRKLYRTDSAQASSPNWVDLSSGLPINAMPSDIEAHPYLDSVVYITLSNKVYKSTDFGVSWTDISSNLPSISFRSIVYDENSKEGLYVGGTPGIYYRDSSMTNWTSFYDGFPLDVSVNELEIYYDTIQPALSKLRAATYGRGLWSSDLYDNGTNKPIADFKSSRTESCPNQFIDFTNRSAYNPTSFSWSIQPAYYQLASGQSLADRNIAVKFDSVGYYSVQLTASNANGSDSVLKINLIHISDSVQASNCVTSTVNGAGYGIGISRIQIANLDHRSSGFDGSNSYHDYSCDGVAYLKPNTDYEIAVTVGSYNDENVEVFIDYNDDGDFTDPGEMVSNFSRGRNVRLDTFRTRSNVRKNQFLKMRVVSDFWGLNGNPCDTLGYGESQDHLVYFDVPELQIYQDATALCQGDTFSFRAEVIGRMDSLKWDFGAGAVPRYGMGFGPHEVSYPQAGLYLPTATLNANNSKSMFVTSWAYPLASLTLDTLGSFCETDSVELELTDTLGLQNVSIHWFLNGSAMSFADSVLTLDSLSLADSGAYWVVTNNLGCADTTSPVMVDVYPRPHVNITVNDTAQCMVGNQFDFRSNLILSSGTASYGWLFGDGSNGGVADPSHVYTQDGQFNIILWVESDQGCEDSAFYQVSVHPQPQLSYSANDTSLCENGHSFSLQNTSSISGGSLTALWDLGDGTTSSSDSVTHSYSSSGIYRVELSLESDWGCLDSTFFNLEVLEQADPQFTYSLIAPATYLFEPTDSTLASYLWTFGDGDSSVVVKPRHNYTVNGQYDVELFMDNLNQCADSNTLSLEVATVGFDEDDENGIRIFPNPSQGKFILQQDGNWEILGLVNELGQEVQFELIRTDEVNFELLVPSRGAFLLHLKNASLEKDINYRLIVN
jgi:PKD repeat protein/photosystem II stability/assembly factor-like uncharacterized protein